MNCRIIENTQVAQVTCGKRCAEIGKQVVLGDEHRIGDRFRSVFEFAVRDQVEIPIRCFDRIGGHGFLALLWIVIGKNIDLTYLENPKRFGLGRIAFAVSIIVDLEVDVGAVSAAERIHIKIDVILLKMVHTIVPEMRRDAAALAVKIFGAVLFARL